MAHIHSKNEPAVKSSNDVVRIQKDDMLSLKKGDVILVRSRYAHEKYGDHYSLIVGGLIAKDRGVRPNLITLPPSNVNTPLLNLLEEEDGVIILKVSDDLKNEILDYYGVHLSEGEIFI